MHLSQCKTAGRPSSVSTRSRKASKLQVLAQAPLTGNTAGASSNSTGNSYLPPLSFDRPAGGGSRSYDLPRSSDSSLVFWAARSDLLRPSNGASRGSVFAAASDSSSSGSIDRPGGRGGRGDMPSGWDTPSSNPSDPALARPGGRGGRDAGLSSSGGSDQAPVSIERPGGRGGRDAGLSSIDQAPSTPSLDRPGGRGGREGPSNGGSSGGGGGSDGGSGGNDGGSGSGDGGFDLGKGVGGVALYAGVIAAAWFGHKAFFAEKKPEAAPVKPCCAGKKKK